MTVQPAIHHGAIFTLAERRHNNDDQSTDFVVEEKKDSNHFSPDLGLKDPTIIHLDKDLEARGSVDSCESQRGILSNSKSKIKKESKTISFSESLQLREYRVGSLATTHSVSKFMDVNRYKSEQRESRLLPKPSNFSWSNFPMFNDDMDIDTSREEREIGETYFTNSSETATQADVVVSLPLQQRKSTASISNKIEIEHGDDKIFIPSQASMVSIWSFILWSFFLIPFQYIYEAIRRLCGRNQEISEVAEKGGLEIIGDMFVDLEE